MLSNQITHSDMYLVYTTDSHHSYGSRDLIGACTSLKSVMGIIKKKAVIEGVKLDEDDYHCLNNYKQTQGLKANFEFDYEEIETNKLL